MYHQINSTEMFRERQLGLLEEAENRRLARQLRAVRSNGQEKGMGRVRRAALLFAAAMAMVVLYSTVALAEIRVGTDNADTLTGTNSADHITGKGGNDTLKGLAANDTYHFDDNFGQDTLTETAFVKVGKKKKRPGGVDTLNFSQYSGSGLFIYMVPQWSVQGFNDVFGPGMSVDLGTSPVENVIGGSGNDNIQGGSANNTYHGGLGGSDTFSDYGGFDGSAAVPALAASDDTYKGFTSATGHDIVTDYGGTADELDLRPLESSEVYFDAFGQDANGSDKSLKIVINDTSSVVVFGHFSPSVAQQENGRMEQIIFSNEVVTSAAELNSLM